MSQIEEKTCNWCHLTITDKDGGREGYHWVCFDEKKEDDRWRESMKEL